MPSIPLLDLNQSSPGDFLAALGTTGFIHLSLSGSPVSSETVARAFAISSYIYDTLPASARAAFPRTADPDFNGSTPLGSIALAGYGHRRGDWKEDFGFGRYPPTKTRSDQGLPPGVDRDALEEFQSSCYAMMLALLDKLALAFELPPDFFRARHAHRGGSGVTLINYPVPPVGTALDSEDVRAGAHKDWGSVTLLFQEDGGQPGLEIFLPDAGAEGGGAWLAAPIIPGTVLVNLGLMMETWTSGRCVATLHRVVFQSEGGKPRKSIAYFGTPDPEVVLQPVGGKSDAGVTEKKAQTVKDFFADRLNQATAQVGKGQY